MIEPVQDRRGAPPLSPQLALRIAILGGFAVVLFAIIFFRLWYLQVLSGDQYLQQARNNRVRTVRVQAPRGDIVDRNGNILVENRAATVVELDPEKLPAPERTAAATWGQRMTARAKRPKGKRGPLVAIPKAPAALVPRLDRLAGVLRMSPRTIQSRIIRSLSMVPYAGVVVKVDVDTAQRNYLAERSDRFPGVTVERRWLRRYPQGALAAQLVGSVGEISKSQLHKKRFKGVHQGTVIGQNGLEWAYDQYLRGVDGSTRIQVDALGRPKGTATGRDPVGGRSVRTTLDVGVQKTGEKYLKQVVDGGPGTAGAFVALDPRDGSVLGMGSYPTFNPSILSRPLSPQAYDHLTNDKYGAPLFNRAIDGAYPTGSTFKPITALAAMSTGVVAPDAPFQDNGCIEIGRNKEQRCNAGHQALGTVNMVSALAKSSDVYFYTAGLKLNYLAGQPLQQWARRLGLGRATGIDVPGEFGGTIPDRAWRDMLNRKEAAWEKAGHPCCRYADGSNRPWSEGDEVNLAVGQGDLQATPVQMAVAYSALENGGRVVRPHLGEAVEATGSGRLLQRIESGAPSRIKIDPRYLGTVQDGLHQATISGTSADVWKGWPQRKYPVFGKTGTAQRPGHPGDQSWYVCYVPGPRPIVVAVTVEDAGWGATAAAPIARTIVSQWFGEPVKFVAGSSHTL